MKPKITFNSRVAPEVFWAPRKDRIFVRIMVRDCADNYDLNISEKKILFRFVHEVVG